MITGNKINSKTKIIIRILFIGIVLISELLIWSNNQLLAKEDSQQVILIRTFSNFEKVERYISENEKTQEEKQWIAILSKSPGKMDPKKIKFYDPEGNLLSTYSCGEWCRVFQSLNKKYVGVLEFKEPSHWDFIFFNQIGQVLWQKENIAQQGMDSGPSQVYISDDGKNVIVTITDKFLLSISFYDSKGNVIKQYSEFKDRERFGSLRSETFSSTGGYFIIVSSKGIFAFDWEGDIIWEYNFSSPYHIWPVETYTSPGGKYIVVPISVDIKEEDGKFDFQSLYFLNREGEYINKYDLEGDIFSNTGKFFNQGDNFVISSTGQVFLFKAANGRLIWNHKFENYYGVPIIYISPNNEWIIVTRYLSDIEREIHYFREEVYLFNRVGEKVWEKGFKKKRFDKESGKTEQMCWISFYENNKFSIKFPDKVLLFEIR